MKAEDLMIGDWVLFFRDVYEKVKVTKEDFGNPTFFPRTKPIPITPEILEKNGFKHIKEYPDYLGMGGYWLSEDERIEINNLSNADEKDWCVHIDNEDMETIGCSDIQYVHELQHALKLCGINKQIIS